MTGSSTLPPHPTARADLHGNAAPGYRPTPPPFAEFVGEGAEPLLDPRTRRWRRALNLLAVFVVGGGAGIAANWWMHKPEPAVRAPAASETQRSAPGKSPVSPGLPAGELPYDAAGGADSVSVPRIPYRIEPLYENVPDSGKALQESKQRVQGKSAASSEQEATDAGKAEARPGKPRNDNAPVSAASGRKAPARAEARPAAAAKRTAAPRTPRKPVPRTREDGELDRIRQQAVDELWRKRVRERMPDQGTAPQSLPLPGVPAIRRA